MTSEAEDVIQKQFQYLWNNFQLENTHFTYILRDFKHFTQRIKGQIEHWNTHHHQHNILPEIINTFIFDVDTVEYNVQELILYSQRFSSHHDQNPLLHQNTDTLELLKKIFGCIKYIYHYTQKISKMFDSDAYKKLSNLTRQTKQEFKSLGKELHNAFDDLFIVFSLCQEKFLQFVHHLPTSTTSSLSGQKNSQNVHGGGRRMDNHKNEILTPDQRSLRLPILHHLISWFR